MKVNHRNGKHGVHHRKVLGGFAAHAARYAARAGMQHLKKRLFEKGVKEENPSTGLETQFAPGHSTLDHVRKISKKSRRDYKKRERFAKKVVKAINKSSKFQQLFKNAITQPSLLADNQGWFEIPIMAGNGYSSPYTDHTDAANKLYSNYTDTGDGLTVMDCNSNALTGMIKASGASGAGGINPGNANPTTLGAGYVHGYLLEYQLQNFNTVAIKYDVFECTCVRNIDAGPTGGPVANVSSFGNASTGLLHLAAAYENTVGSSYSFASSQQFQAITEASPFANPFMFQYFGRYFRIDKHHTHVLDPGQTLQLDKRYKFNKAIKNADFYSCVAKKGVTRCILICYKANTPPQQTGASTNGNVVGPLAAVAYGVANLATHSCGIIYNKRFIVMPDSSAVGHEGAGQLY